MSEGIHLWSYKKNRSEAHQRLDEEGWRKRKCKDGTFTVEGCLHWNPETGAWRSHDGSATGTGVGEMMHFLRSRPSRLRGDQPQEAQATPTQKPEPHPHAGMFQVRLVVSKTFLDLGISRGVGCSVTCTGGDVLACDGYWDAKELTDLLNRQAGASVALCEKVG